MCQIAEELEFEMEEKKPELLKRSNISEMYGLADYIHWFWETIPELNVIERKLILYNDHADIEYTDENGAIHSREKEIELETEDIDAICMAYIDMFDGQPSFLISNYIEEGGDGKDSK